MKKDLDTILKISFDYCKYQDDEVADFFRKINDTAYRALKHIEKHPQEDLTQTEKYRKNYYINGVFEEVTRIHQDN